MLVVLAFVSGCTSKNPAKAPAEKTSPKDVQPTAPLPKSNVAQPSIPTITSDKSEIKTREAITISGYIKTSETIAIGVSY